MDKVFLERPSVNEVLRDKIRKYKKEHSRLSSNQIARRLGLPPSTFHRLEMGDVKNPGLDICVTVLNGLCSKKETAEFVREYFPEVHESLYGYFQDVTKLEAHDKDIEKYFQEQLTYKMMLKASSAAGLVENEVLQDYGREGHKTFMKLAADGVFINKNGRFFLSDSDLRMSGYSANKVNELIYKELAEEFSLTQRNKKCSRSLWVESLNLEKVLPELRELTEEYDYKMKKIMMNPDNFGTDLVAYSSLLKKL
ncbi:hypothetical protein M902_1474 [Bacteriovorax sp. BAL6_X]|uniref:helix-turn-helix domain-containing protein n=1 Tax=Bacteriovorax sp. BAL6_X TaxID=1201290 RepID=UPI000385631E|nr:helix-turn-helix domain-containing protein [Bacteriovorax sp. BAL6_X]EPZ50536.1 hypothetical protein M902_1474 [Bacteriovorax sp. BAL6_X]